MRPVRIGPDRGDWIAILELLRSAFAFMEGRIDPPSSLDRLTPEDIRRQAREGEVWLMLDDWDRPVASMFLTYRIHCLVISKLAVHPRSQGKGIGRALIDLAAERATARGLPMLELQTRVELTENHAAFARLGFVKHAETRHPGYARTTSITMRKALAPGRMTGRRVLFICGKARARSPTAAQIFADYPGVSTDFGGVSRDADDALSRDQIEWADLIVVMEQRHRTRLADRFGRALRGRRIVCAGIPDRYSFMQPELIAILTEKAAPFLR